VEKYLKLTLLNMKGENLEEMDSAMFGGLSDPYFKVTTDPPNLLMKDNKVLSFHTSPLTPLIASLLYLL
jgi:hypothetical protein